jgi:FkbM family methyltransferase
MISLAHSFVRTVNHLNPTTHGRLLLTTMADRVLGRPRNGVYSIESRIAMDLDMSEWLEAAIYYHAFEPLCRSIILGHLTPGAVFVDIGANIGFYSLQARKRVGPEGRVVAFEPNPDTVKKLKRNLQLNGMEIELFEAALSNRVEVVTLYSPEGCHGETSMRHCGGRQVSEKQVPAVRLDDVFPRDIDRIDFLKIDVEGAEAMVFEGAQTVLRRFRPPVLLEINEKASLAFGYAPYDATKILMQCNPEYRIYEVTSHRITPVTMAQLEAKVVHNTNLLLTCGDLRQA